MNVESWAQGVPNCDPVGGKAALTSGQRYEHMARNCALDQRIDCPFSGIASLFCERIERSAWSSSSRPVRQKRKVKCSECLPLWVKKGGAETVAANNGYIRLDGGQCGLMTV